MQLSFQLVVCIPSLSPLIRVASRRVECQGKPHASLGRAVYHSTLASWELVALCMRAHAYMISSFMEEIGRGRRGGGTARPDDFRQEVYQVGNYAEVGSHWTERTEMLPIGEQGSAMCRINWPIRAPCAWHALISARP
ncbi:hypothetical protein LY76DRAFT_365624 [Colletotrichum caudatum]|nr:hypothetical protein LY76DRAFT_365624 [Colletotrichum caudatum]